MPIMTYRGEKTVGEIADKMFERLTPRQKLTAEAEILKANPRLADPSTLAKGTILKMPDIAELRPKTSRALENPDALLAKHLAQALDDFGQRFDARATQATDDSRRARQARARHRAGPAGTGRADRQAAGVAGRRCRGAAQVDGRRTQGDGEGPGSLRPGRRGTPAGRAGDWGYIEVPPRRHRTLQCVSRRSV